MQDYKDAKEKVANYVSDNARPLVAWLYYQPAGDFFDEAIELKFGAFQTDYMQDAGGRLLDFDALSDTYTPDNEHINQKAERSLEFKNLTTTGSILAEILKDVNIIVDETNHHFIPGQHLCLGVHRKCHTLPIKCPFSLTMHHTNFSCKYPCH